MRTPLAHLGRLTKKDCTRIYLIAFHLLLHMVSFNCKKLSALGFWLEAKSEKLKAFDLP
jgi:hypothetical protein